MLAGGARARLRGAGSCRARHRRFLGAIVAVTELPQERVPVTIVGGGPIGLTMGLLLGRFGVPAVILERNATTTDHPKARGCFARTMELFRVSGRRQGDS